MSEFYEIKVKESFDQSWSEWFSDLELSQVEGGGTLFSGSLPDQTALHGLLRRIRDLNLTLVSVNCNPASLSQNRKGDFHEQA